MEITRAVKNWKAGEQRCSSSVQQQRWWWLKIKRGWGCVAALCGIQAEFRKCSDLPYWAAEFQIVAEVAAVPQPLWLRLWKWPHYVIQCTSSVKNIIWALYFFCKKTVAKTYKNALKWTKKGAKSAILTDKVISLETHSTCKIGKKYVTLPNIIEGMVEIFSKV